MDYYLFTLYYKNIEVTVQIEDSGRVLMYSAETGELFFDSMDNYCSDPKYKEVYNTIELIKGAGLRVLSATIDDTIVYNVE